MGHFGEIYFWIGNSGLKRKMGFGGLDKVGSPGGHRVFAAENLRLKSRSASMLGGTAA